MLDLRPKILMRLLVPRRRVFTVRGHVGRLKRKDMTRTSPNVPLRRAGYRQVMGEVRAQVGAWDSTGESGQGREELAALIRRVER
jgi:hypothetical protein